MIQFLISLIEWIALAGLMLLGVSYESETPCPSPAAQFTTIEYVAVKTGTAPAALGPDHSHAQSSDCLSTGNPEWLPADADEIILIRI